LMHLHLRSVRAPFRILLLESEGRSRDLHAMILMTHGYDIECTANYIQAWNMWRAKRPDLILVALDIRDMRLFGLSVQLNELVRQLGNADFMSTRHVVVCV
ncbi:MAG: hypothetical protein ACM3JB_16225, partial [Acidobacteriaceae bacterium]